MMKKNGFTLAEVLITLAIIGVVATITLPALMTNTQEQQARTALKKGINTLTEAASMNKAIDGYDYSELVGSAQESQSLYSLLDARTAVDYQLTSTPNSGNYTIYLRDGSSIIYPRSLTSSGATCGSHRGTAMQNDNMVYGVCVIYDTNGQKAPNILSNCRGNATATDTDSDTSNNANCNNKSQRVIKDRFGLRLRGTYVVPNGAASRWAFNN